MQERFNKECYNRNIGLSENFLTDAKSEHKGVISMIKVLLIQSGEVVIEAFGPVVHVAKEQSIESSTHDDPSSG